MADTLIALAFAGATFTALQATFEVLRGNPNFVEPATPRLLFAVLAPTLPLALRRRFPVTVAGTVVIAWVVSRAILDVNDLTGLTVWACLLALYSAAVHRRKTRLTAIALAAIAAILLGEVVRELYFVEGGMSYEGLPLTQAVLVVYNAAVLILPVILGIAVRSLRDRERQLAVQATELQHERQENAQRAVLDERVRIARELHDVVAHHVSLMGIQAGAARRVMGRQPDKAAEALSSVEASSRQAVVELHRLLGFLRRDGQNDELAPQPDLAQLADLVAQTSHGALAVDLTVEGEPRSLPPTLEVSAYRVIQEALTNAVKHSGGTAATVRVIYTPTRLEIVVRDDGSAAVVPPLTKLGGHGLIGMRERVSLHGGHLRAGPDPKGGFAVHATFPLNGET